MVVESIESELRRITKLGQVIKDRQILLSKLHDKVQALPDDVWDTLSTPAQDWINEATLAKNDGNPLPEFPDVAAEEAAKDDEDKTVAKAPSKKAAPVKGGAPAKNNARKMARPAAKPVAKPVAKSAAKPATKAAKPEAKTSGGKKASKASGEVTGVKAKIKSMIMKKPDITADEIVAKLSANGADISRLTVTAVRSEFRHSLRCLKQEGYLPKISI